MKRLLLLLIILRAFPVHGQTQTFDIATFPTLTGWHMEKQDYAIAFDTVDQTARTWCKIAIYKSIDSGGDPTQDFRGEWKAIIEKSYKPESNPDPVATVQDGWTVNAAASKFQWQNEDAYVLLTTLSGYGRLMSIMVLMNSDDYMPAIERFLDAMDLKKPAGVVDHQESVTAAVVKTQPATPGNNGISFSTTNFDDGWVAQPMADYVQVKKGLITVFLHYPMKIGDAERDAVEFERAFWDKLAASRYQAKSITKFVEGPTYFRTYFLDVEAVDLSTGKPCYVGFRIIPNNGIAKCIEIIAPSMQDFKNAFPDQEKVAAMLNYNKFAVTAKDLVGTWDSSSGAYVDMYSVSTGQYAGMNTSSSADSFEFHGDGSYSSHHSGAFGMVGSMQFYDQKYNGKLTVTPWDITVTNRFKGKTDVYWAQYEAVKGGRVLHLTDKTASGIQYHLVKVK